MINKINDFDDADKAMKELCEIKQIVSTENNILNKHLDDLKMVSTNKLQPLLSREKELEKMLKTYAIKNKKEFTEKRSKELTFGIIGFRKSSAIAYNNARDVITKLQELGMNQCFKITERIDKNELSKFKDSVLERLGVKRKEKDEFYLKLKYEEVINNE